ncbi:MAG: stage II sporulation protein D [Firmicutes bacterium]|nr:stage II sporulation protein D [Bacillota bacterium]
MPYIKVFLISIVCMSILLIFIPMAITHIVPDNMRDDDKDNASYPYDKVDLPKTISVYRTESGSVDKLPFEEYIKGVVSCEMPSTFHSEALKAQAVAARTYSAAKVINSETSGNPLAHPSAPLCDSTHCQVFKTEKELKVTKGEAWMKEGYERICDAVDDTEGQLLYYKGELVQQALFHSSSGGATENCEDVFTAAVPYLVSVESPYEDEATHQDEETAFTVNEFISLIRSAYPTTQFGNISSNNIKIISRSSGNRVDKIQVGSGTLTGRQVREALGLSSANFTIDINGDTITFTSNGSGHGVGMSQYGADGMAKKGYDYKKILSHYYSGTEVY